MILNNAYCIEDEDGWIILPLVEIFEPSTPLEIWADSENQKPVKRRKRNRAIPSRKRGGMYYADS